MGDLYANKGDHKKAIMYLERAHSPSSPRTTTLSFFYSEQLHAIGALESELALLRDAAEGESGIRADVGDVFSSRSARGVVRTPCSRSSRACPRTIRRVSTGMR